MSKNSLFHTQLEKVLATRFSSLSDPQKDQIKQDLLNTYQDYLAHSIERPLNLEDFTDQIFLPLTEEVEESIGRLLQDLYSFALSTSPTPKKDCRTSWLDFWLTQLERVQNKHYRLCFDTFKGPCPPLEQIFSLIEITKELDWNGSSEGRQQIQEISDQIYKLLGQISQTPIDQTSIQFALNRKAQEWKKAICAVISGFGELSQRCYS